MNLKEECIKGAEAIGVDLSNPEYEARLNRELGVINEKEFDNYFLIWADIVRWAESNGIMVGPGRGCLKGNSPVLTKDGFIPIKYIEVGAEVMAHDGKYHRVVNRFKYDNADPMIKIRTYYDAQGVSVTPDHKMLVSKMNSDPSPGGRRFAKEPSPVKWVEANMVEEGDMLVIPRVKLDEKFFIIDLGDYAPSDSEIGEEFICEKVGGNQHHKAYSLLIPRYVRADYSLGFFLGFWSANGWFAKAKPNLIGLCCNKDDNDGSVHDLMFNLFNLVGNEFSHKTKHAVQFEFRSKTIKTFVERLVPEYSLSAKTKTLAGFNLSWNKEYLRGLVDGAWNGDGTFSPKTRWGKTAYSSTSQTLVRQLRQVLWSLGIPASLRSTYRKETRKGWGGDRIEYTLVAPAKIYGEVKNQMGYVDEKYIYQRVFKIEEEEPEVFVYDIEVENQHSFVTESYTVHNSAAGSLVSYLLGITKIDPLEHGLFFERFLDASRPDNPDIDEDFQASRRQEIFKYVREKYGEEFTARIATFSHFHIKQTLRDLCRIFSIPMNVSNKLGSVIPTGTKTVEEACEFKEVEEFFGNYPLLKELAEDMTGAIRQKSVHAAGMVITPEPIREYMSLEKVKGELCTCFDMEVIDAMGILKLDILGLKTLDIIAKALELAGLGQDVLPRKYNDPKVYEIFQRGETLGVFQFKSQLLTNLAKKLGIADFKTLYAATTIARPGPLHSGEAEKYISRHNGEAKVEYLHDRMIPITDDTYGLILYQEQVMQISQQMAEFTSAESNVLRKVIGKSKGKAAIDEYMDKFISGCINEQIEQSIAEEIWNIIREAGAYSFNKSHAVSYSAVSYWCAWLRTYYPKEWLVAVMNYEEDNIQADAVRELRRIGADILPPSINYSTENVQIAEDGKIYMGLRDVEGCGEKAVKNIISKQPYTSFDNFLSRVTRRTVNKRVVANLIQAGAFDEFGEQRVDLYDTVTGPGETDHQYWDEKEQLRRQIMVLDMPAAKPLIDYYPNKYEQKVDITPMRNIEFGDKTPEIWVKGIITDFTPKLANSHGVAVVGEPNMAYFDLDDGSKKVSCFIAPEQLYLFKHILSDGEPVLLKTHTFGNTEKLYVDGALNLEKDEQNSPVLEKYAFGITEEERQTTQGTNVSIVSYANYYISKNGNPYVRIITTDEDNLLLFKGFDNQPFLPGEIIAWNTNKLPFINLERRII